MTQADRDAAADLHRAIYGTHWDRADEVDRQIRSGETDTEKKVQAFARHRIASEQATAQAERERTIDECARVADEAVALFETMPFTAKPADEHTNKVMAGVIEAVEEARRGTGPSNRARHPLPHNQHPG
jgi:hypothetical protein